MKVVIDVTGFYEWEPVDDPEQYYSWVPVVLHEDDMTEDQRAELDAWREDGPPEGFRFTDDGDLERWQTSETFLVSAQGRTLRRVVEDRETHVEIALQPASFPTLIDSVQEHMVNTEKDAILWWVNKAMQDKAPRDRWVKVTVEGDTEGLSAADAQRYLATVLELGG